MPRGIQGATLAPASIMGGVAVHPAWFAALAAESPRLVGGAYHSAGRVAGQVSRAAERMPLNGTAIARGGTIAGAGGNLYQEAEALAELKRKRRK
jgi:hypothetical protein